ncbi:hypothetical protein Q5752_006953 [Cryptotrichosporon argae]
MADSKAEQYLILARTTKGAAAAKIVLDATAAPGVYAFSELLDVPGIQALAEDAQFQPHFRLLELFAYGTLQDYAETPSSFPPQTPAHQSKLKQLTLVSLALQSRSLAYSTLLSALQLDSTRALEDVIIDTIYAGLLGGKIHHHEQVLHVDWVAGRDVRDEDLTAVKAGLDAWCANASRLLSALDDEISRTRQTAADDSAALLAYSTARDKAYADLLAKNDSRVSKGMFDFALSHQERSGIGASSGSTGPPASETQAKQGLRSGKQGLGARLSGGPGRMNVGRSTDQGDRGVKRPRD